MSDLLHAGEFNRYVEFFTTVKEMTPTKERVEVPLSLGRKKVKRIDVSGEEDEDGKLIALSVSRFQMRYDRDILLNGSKYYIEDDGMKFQINSVNLYGPGRNRFLELKCSSRG